ncbi:DUF1684 domain-containing protein [Robertkochia solimangrovi]|uniref:DUF1684 domain-containing protein n=1 Tax=Robertkochia solimangrovi TaxID=2213046 RepID=UPI00117D22E9|nr:DUF1684 domain-containing protein [Robertkochia solimangrovi]TRZ43733.1 DUF1684 domain-containing protein [Robertkochia solimangrovi]
MKTSQYLMLAGMATLCIVSCKDEKRYHESSQNHKEEVIFTDTVQKEDFMSSVKSFRDELNAEYADPERSPLTQDDLAAFSGLEFFPADSAFRVVAKFTRTPNNETILLPTTTERVSEEVIYGVLDFELQGKPFRLNLYQSLKLMQQEEYKDYLFLPFSDQTNGKESYGGGRYLDMRIPEGDTMVIDFNKAYNPYCAYNKKFSCPLVPKENTLDVAIPVGVKKFH